MWRTRWVRIKEAQAASLTKSFQGRKTWPKKECVRVVVFTSASHWTNPSVTRERHATVCVSWRKKTRRFRPPLIPFATLSEEASARILDNYRCGAIMEFGWDVIMSLPNRRRWPGGSSESSLLQWRKLLLSAKLASTALQLCLVWSASTHICTD